MLSNLDPAAQQFLNGLNDITSRMNRAQQQLSSGSRIQSVSDAPDQISTLLQARANLDSVQQTLTNLARVKTEVDAGEQALSTSVQLFDQVRTLGAQGATSTQTASGRAAIADQIDGLLQEMAGLAGTSVEGRHIFSGDADQLAPYIYTAASTPPVSAYQGSAATRLIQHPNGTTFPVAETAQQIFDSADPTTNVFSTMEALSTALRNNDTPTIQTIVAGLGNVNDYLNSQLAFYGATQNKVTDATSFGQTLQVQLQTQISNLQDTDMTQAILEMQQAQTQQQAALTSRAQLPRKTLFDYLA